MSRLGDALRRFVDAEDDDAVMQAVWNGEVIAESDRTVTVEGNHYFPREDVEAERLEPSDRTSVCPWKGVASYYDVVVDGARSAGGAWYYARPSPLARKVKDHVAFWRGVEVRRAPARLAASDRVTSGNPDMIC